jgi:hypothetical protein
VGRLKAHKRAYQNKPPTRVLLLDSLSGDKAEPAIYAATIENCADRWMTVYLDRQHGAFHGTSPELGWQNSATRARLLPQPLHDGHDDSDQDAGEMPM